MVSLYAKTLGSLKHANKQTTGDNIMNDESYYKTKLLNVDAWHDGDGWTWNNWHTIEDGIYLHETVNQRGS